MTQEGGLMLMKSLLDAVFFGDQTAAIALNLPPPESDVVEGFLYGDEESTAAVRQSWGDYSSANEGPHFAHKRWTERRPTRSCVSNDTAQHGFQPNFGCNVPTLR